LIAIAAPPDDLKNFLVYLILVGAAGSALMRFKHRHRALPSFAGAFPAKKNRGQHAGKSGPVISI
jgi:hypothetical protein